MINNKDESVFSFVYRNKVNWENKSLEELKKYRENFNLKQVSPDHPAEAYMIKMIDVLLDKVEKLEKLIYE